jgi:hypothetical protein
MVQLNQFCFGDETFIHLFILDTENTSRVAWHLMYDQAQTTSNFWVPLVSMKRWPETEIPSPAAVCANTTHTQNFTGWDYFRTNTVIAQYKGRQITSFYLHKREKLTPVICLWGTFATPACMRSYLLQTNCCSWCFYRYGRGRQSFVIWWSRSPWHTNPMMNILF